jgi:hypothetical protein
VEEEDPDNGENIIAQQKLKGMVNKNYLFLDNQSTVNQIANPNMLKNIRKSSKPIKIHCNAGIAASLSHHLSPFSLVDFVVHHCQLIHPPAALPPCDHCQFF